jgi:hypothetical protein
VIFIGGRKNAENPGFPAKYKSVFRNSAGRENI